MQTFPKQKNLFWGGSKQNWLPILTCRQWLCKSCLIKLPVSTLTTSYRPQNAQIWQNWQISLPGPREVAPPICLRSAPPWCPHTTGTAVAGRPRTWQVRSSYKNVGKGTPTALLQTARGGGREWELLYYIKNSRYSISTFAWFANLKLTQ